MCLCSLTLPLPFLLPPRQQELLYCIILRRSSAFLAHECTWIKMDVYGSDQDPRFGDGKCEDPDTTLQYEQASFRALNT